jgi:hypothetical protein
MKHILFLVLICFSCTQLPGHWETAKPEPNQIGGTQNLKTILEHTDWQRFDNGRLTWRYSFTDGQFGPNGFCARPFGQATECAPNWVWGTTLPSIITIWKSHPPDSVFAWKVFYMTQDSMILRPVIFGTEEYGEPFTLIPR